VTPYLCLLSGGISIKLVTNIPPCKWALQERFSRSEVKGKGYSETRCTFAAEAYNTFRRCGVEDQLFKFSVYYFFAQCSFTRHRHEHRRRPNVSHHRCYYPHFEPGFAHLKYLRVSCTLTGQW